MTPLERAARALCLADGLDPDRKFKSSDWSEGTAPHEFAWHEYLPKARAALEAIREPTEGMIAETSITDDEYYFHTQEIANEWMKGQWQAMIDAALAEGVGS